MLTPDTIGCEEALKRLLEYIDRELEGSDAEVMERHLRTCRSCFSRMEFEGRLKGQLSALSTAEAPEKARDRIRDLIRRF